MFLPDFAESERLLRDVRHSERGLATVALEGARMKGRWMADGGRALAGYFRARM